MMNEYAIKHNFPKSLTLIFITLLSYLLILFINKNFRMPAIELSPQETTVHFNEKLIKALSLGQKRMLSSFLWSETLLKSDIKHYKGNDLQSWMFLRLKLITTLDPKFYIAYLYGGTYLSIIKDDLKGASYIFNKGLENYTLDFDLNFIAAFHFYYEVGNYQKAIETLERIAHRPKAPPYLQRVLSRLKAEKGNLQDAFVIIKSLYDAAPENSLIKKKHERNLFFIKTELDLKCLNKGKKGCPIINYHGLPYVFKNGKWFSPEPWNPYRIQKTRAKKSLRKNGG